jgi:TrmH family RNA methyltransferase
MGSGWRQYLHLQKKKNRYEEHKFIIEGVRLCHEGLLSGWEMEAALVTGEFTRSRYWLQFEELFKQRKISWRIIPDQHFNRLADTGTPQGVLMIMRMPSYQIDQMNLRKTAFVVLLQGVRDPGNLGTIIRTADWFGAGAVILSDDCVDPFNSKVLRGSMGSIFHLPVFSTQKMTEEIRHLKENRFWVVAASVKGNKILQQLHLKKPVALLLGGEVQGISADLEKHADVSARIWKYGRAESLNVAIAGSVFMNHIATQILK